LSTAVPRRLADVTVGRRPVVTVCDRAHEELDPTPSGLHWSIDDPVANPSKAAFDRTVTALRERITSLVDVA
jgi:ArsR family transcriptional regulator, arsenate/arsenite/antimonite-responsive transcriptional repressor / arsenate reductase (thioredoxin)